MTIRIRNKFLRRTIFFLKKYLLAGVLVLIPLWLTYFIFRFAIRLVDDYVVPTILPYLPQGIQDNIPPGFGVLVLLLSLLLLGFLSSNVFGKWIIGFYESIIQILPGVRDIYGGIKKVTQKFTGEEEQTSFSETVLVEYPRKGCWMIAFITNRPGGEIGEKMGRNMVTLFVPLVPLPTQGMLFMVPEREVKKLKMPPQIALGLLVSLGVGQTSKKDDENTGKLMPFDKQMMQKLIAGDKKGDHGILNIKKKLGKKK